MLSGKTAQEYYAAGGDEILRLNYNIDTSKRYIIVDLGGYRGKWTDQMLTKYGTNCLSFLYEPIPSYFELCKNNLKHHFSENNHPVVFNNYALSNKDGTQKISLTEDSSSLFIEKDQIEIKTYDIADFNWGKNIDVIKINIEGAEYDVMERLIETNNITNFKNFQIQFHNYESVPNYAQRRDKIREHLSKTHHLTYDFEYIWENWEIN
jgi:FkbM family methyltransferase